MHEDAFPGYGAENKKARVQEHFIAARTDLKLHLVHVRGRHRRREMEDEVGICALTVKALIVYDMAPCL